MSRHWGKYVGTVLTRALKAIVPPHLILAPGNQELDSQALDNRVQDNQEPDNKAQVVS